MPAFTRRDVSLFYRDHQPVHASGDAPIVLIHGLLVNSLVWEPIRPFLDHRRVLVPDLRGHGRSHPDTPNTLSHNVDDIAALIRSRKLRPATIVGSSIGGIIATELAHRYPDVVDSVITIGSFGHLTVIDPAFAEAMTALVSGLRSEVDSTAAAAVPTWFGPLTSSPAFDWALEMTQSADRSVVELAESVLGWDPRPYLADIARPLHYVRGAHDAIPPTVDELTALTPGARTTVLDHAGHMPHVEMPALVSGLILQSAAAPVPHPPTPNGVLR